MPRLKLVAAAAIMLLSYTSYALEDFNVTDSDELTVYNYNGEEVLITQELMNKLNEESETWHWKPWLRTKTEMMGNILIEVERGSINSFPAGVFDDQQLRSGAFLLYMLFGIYAFTLLAIVCNDYFIPCVELICEDLKIPQNVAAATFMAVATSCPEFFVNIISTFLTASDMGIGTIVGSAIFNVLGVAAVGSLAAVLPISIEPRPVTRDTLIYIFNLGILVVIVWDGMVVWYEALVLGILYVCYFIIMFNSQKIFNLYDTVAALCCRKTVGTTEYVVSTNEKPLEDASTRANNDVQANNHANNVVNKEKCTESEKVEVEEKPKKSLFRFPKEKSYLYKVWWLYIWPLKLILGLTVPSPVTRPRFYPLSFIMCFVWIGVNSYLVSWSMTVLGHTFFIPESVMGMTFLAFGGCLPEACSIFIMSRRGEGGIGISNALGANSLAILFALGVPWLIKSLTLLAEGANTAVTINSEGIDVVVISLIVAVCVMWICLYLAKFKLRKSLGIVLVIFYSVFITFAILVEMQIILNVQIGIS